MKNRLLIPCMQGTIGDWVTYTCLMRLADIAELVSYADDIHKNKKLSCLIQRELKKDRQKEIGEYLLTEKEAFLNSLVVAIYDGQPKWHRFDTITAKQDLLVFEAPDYALECMGYLSLSRDEKIFALDGQHRLSGIQYALMKNSDLGKKQIPVTFLPHYNDSEGLKRTRRLFTTLNKKAKPVDKAAIISLDEDDVCACTTRYLVEDSDLFNGEEIKYQANNNVSYTDTEVLTTIGNLYDLVKEILKNIKRIPSKNIENYRGSEAEKEEIFLFVEDVFRYLFGVIEVLKEYKNTEDKKSIVNRYRNRVDGGNFLFRPAGLKIYLIAMGKYVKSRSQEVDISIKDFIDASADLDFSMEGALLRDNVWDSERKVMIVFKAEVRNTIIARILQHVENRT